MKTKLTATRRLFVVSIVSLAMLGTLLVGAVLYATSVVRFHNEVSSNTLHELTKDYPAVSSYLESQKKAEAHFVTLANLIKTDQQRLLGRALLIVVLPTLAISGLLGYLLARRLLAPVEESFASKERFLQDAAHELRNPLAAMSAVVEQAKTQSESITSSGRLLDTLDRQTKQLVKLNEDLLLLERGRDVGGAKPVVVSELLLDIVDSLRSQAARKNIQLKTKVANDCVITIQSADFICIARNIIENAIKYSKPDSKVVNISLERQRQQVVLKVKDNGVGIPAADQPYVGERFFRGTNVGKTAGTGLGMAIVDSVVDAYSGKLQVTSQVNVGTTVTVSFSH